MHSDTPYLVVDSLMKHYGEGEARVQVLDDITTTVNRGEVCVMLGPSGSGKSTFLNLIGGLEGADGGSIRVGGTELISAQW
jgi:putative ABC transport system ATP-binding protein